jgi:hypothetical protein
MSQLIFIEFHGRAAARKETNERFVALPLTGFTNLFALFAFNGNSA